MCEKTVALAVKCSYSSPVTLMKGGACRPRCVAAPKRAEPSAVPSSLAAALRFFIVSSHSVSPYLRSRDGRPTREGEREGGRERVRGNDGLSSNGNATPSVVLSRDRRSDVFVSTRRNLSRVRDPSVRLSVPRARKDHPRVPRTPDSRRECSPCVFFFSVFFLSPLGKFSTISERVNWFRDLVL